MRLFNDLIGYGAVFVTGELIALLIFYFMARSFKKRMTWQSAGRGSLERLFLFVCLVNKLPQALILFGALKIGTRLKNSQENPISNDYFLTGNLASVLIGVIYFLVIEKAILL